MQYVLALSYEQRKSPLDRGSKGSAECGHHEKPAHFRNMRAQLGAGTDCKEEIGEDG